MDTNGIPRRKFVASLGVTGIAAATGVYFSTDRATAVDVSMKKLEITEQNASSPNEPSSVDLTISGDYQVDANVQPTLIQINPTGSVEGGLGEFEFNTTEIDISTKDASGNFEFTLGLLNISALQTSFPATEGDSLTETVTITLDVIVLKDGAEIGRSEVTETFDLVFTHEKATAAIGIDATGSVVAK